MSRNTNGFEQEAGHPSPSRSAADFLPTKMSLSSLRAAEQSCRGCELYAHATQAVGGEGLASASLMLVGEAPGDAEDEMGHPFVGPAGKLLDQTLAEAGIDRKDVFITNAVKHFKWTPSGTRRLHAKPSAREVKACHPWLESEIELVEPDLIVCLGATAAQSLLGRDFRMTARHGEILAGPHGSVMATYHPSSVLRAPSSEQRKQLRQLLVDDFRIAAEYIHKS